MGRRDSRRKRSRSRSSSRSRTRRRSRERRARTRRSRSRSGTRKRRYRSRSRSSSSSDRGRERRGHYRAHRSRRSSSSDDSSRSSSPDQRGRANRSGQSSKVESRSSTPESQVKTLGLARNQAIITAMLNKTDEKYKAAEARNKPQAAPVSSVLASLESDEFVPQPFVSHRTARTGSGETVQAEQEEENGNQGNHDAAMFGGSDTAKLPVATETISVLEEPTANPKQLDSLSESERLQLWLKRLRSLRELYGPPPSAPPHQQ